MDPISAPPVDESESPTQCNEGRSYDRYKDPESLPQFNLHSLEERHDGDRSLNEDDTGAVKFSLSSTASDFDSAAGSDADGLHNERSLFFANSENGRAAAAAASAAAPPEPETPAAPKNPFAGKFQTPLLAGSQLFAQTPFSAGFHQGSPTSSRPSPSNLPAPASTPRPAPLFSSSLKPRFPASNTGEETPINIVALSTSSPAFEGATPLPPETPGPVSVSAAIAQSSPTRRGRRPLGPLAEYEPMRHSQARREACELRPGPDADFDSSSDDSVDRASQKRRKLARRKREEGAKMLSTISMSRTSRKEDIIEVPASTRKEVRPRPRQAPQLCPESDLQAAEDTALVEDSGEVLPHAQDSFAYEDTGFPSSYGHRRQALIKTPSSSAPSLPANATAAHKFGQGQASVLRSSSLNERQAIPETSPAAKPVSVGRPSSKPSSPVLPDVAPSMVEENALDEHEPPYHALVVTQTPLTVQRALPRAVAERGGAEIYAKSQEEEESPVPSPRPAARPADEETRPPAEPKLDAKGDINSSSPILPPAFRTGGRRKHEPSTDSEVQDRLPTAPSISTADRSMSEISCFSRTPSLPSREATPGTAAESDSSTRGGLGKKKVAGEAARPPRPALSRSLRSQKSGTLPRLKAGSGSSRSLASAARRPSPLYSGSTDELAGSPTRSRAGAAAPVRAANARRTSARRSTSRSATTRLRRQSSLAGGIFQGMAFAITFQNDKEQTRGQLQKRIEEAGGQILEDGFDELVEAPAILSEAAGGTGARTCGGDGDEDDVCLRPEAEDTRFTAVIADGHSRKAKYIQALALGLPCLAVRWATTCLDRGALVEWTPYLLCAGPSAYLGDAIRSRSLVPYDAATAELADVVRARPRLLRGVEILLVLRESEEDHQRVYVFLLHVLGAHLTRARSLDDAREQLLAREDAGRPFDWVVDGKASSKTNSRASGKTNKAGGKTGSRAGSEPQSSLLQSLFQTGGAARKRKRSGERIPQAVALLSNERVVQSLILGKLIEEGEAVS